tara:strand:+ start:5547 stop:5999 length:453 start_codon:yes stop_codon:yes gene_type:complete
MSDKKKFKDTTVGKLLLGVATVINPTLGKVLEGVTDPKQAIEEISKSDISTEDKIKLQELLYQSQIYEMQEVSKRWNSDMTSDNKLSKSVRPLTLIFLFVSTVLLIFIDSGFINFAVDDEWKELLKMLLITITAAYFGGRSYEKGKSIQK